MPDQAQEYNFTPQYPTPNQQTPDQGNIPNYEDIDNKFGFVVFRDFPGATAQTATNYSYIFTPPFGYAVGNVVEKHGTLEAGVTLDVLKVPNGIAVSSGVSILATKFDLGTTADTAINKSGLALNSNRSFNPLDSIALKLSAGAVALKDLQITIYL